MSNRYCCQSTRFRICGLILLGSLSVAVSDSAAQEQRERPLPKPEIIELEAGDGIRLAATYFPPENAGKETPVVVLLHMHQRDQKSWEGVARGLQRKGIAALTVDLRGHGESKDQGGRRPLDASTFRKNDFLAMVAGDMEAVKRELVIRHNKGQLNIERLGVVGAEMGASIAVLWSGWDWTNAGGKRPDYTTIEGGKRGRDVKALVLLSPQYNFKGVTITPAHITLMKNRLAVAFFAGSEERSARDTERMHRLVAVSNDDEKHPKGIYNTKLRGTDLLSSEVGPQPAPDLIVDFLQRMLQKEVRGPEVAWQLRRQPFGLQPE